MWQRYSHTSIDGRHMWQLSAHLCQVLPREKFVHYRMAKCYAILPVC